MATAERQMTTDEQTIFRAVEAVREDWKRKQVKATAKAVTTTISNGMRLFIDGYSIAPTQTAGCYTVTTPVRVDKSTGEMYVIDYTVDLFGGTCNCAMFGGTPDGRFRGRGVCKHIVGVTELLAAYQKAMEEANRLLHPVATVPLPVAMPETIMVNGRAFTDAAAARAYRMQLDFG